MGNWKTNSKCQSTDRGAEQVWWYYWPWRMHRASPAGRSTSKLAKPQEPRWRGQLRRTPPARLPGGRRCPKLSPRRRRWRLRSRLQLHVHAARRKQKGHTDLRTGRATNRARSETLVREREGRSRAGGEARVVPRAKMPVRAPETTPASSLGRCSAAPRSSSGPSSGAGAAASATSIDVAGEAMAIAS